LDVGPSVLTRFGFFLDKQKEYLREMTSEKVFDTGS